MFSGSLPILIEVIAVPRTIGCVCMCRSMARATWSMA